MWEQCNFENRQMEKKKIIKHFSANVTPKRTILIVPWELKKSNFRPDKVSEEERS
jgi:hypothetical protein